MGKFLTSLRSRLILLIILTSIPGILLLLRKGLDQRAQAVRAAEEEVVHLGQIASNTQEVMVDNVKAFLLTLSHLPTLRERDMAACQEIFSHLVTEHFKYYSSFYVADLQGNILCTPPERHTPPDFNECDHYKNLIQSTDFTLSGYHICKNTGKAVLSIGYPILDNQDRRILVANVSMDLIWFFDFARDAKLPKGSELILLNQKGTILSHFPDNNLWRGKPLPGMSVLNELLAQGEGVRIGTGLDGRESVYAIAPMTDTMENLFVVIGQPTSIAFAEANRTLFMDMAILVLVLAAVSGLTWYLGDVLIVKQAQTLVRATQQLADGDYTVQTGMDYSRGELGAVAHSFDVMAREIAQREAERDKNEAVLTDYARNLEHSNQELRDFANIAAHDLQEPLRKIQTFGELLQERCAPGLGENGKDYVRRMQAASSRMQTLIAALHSYSRVNTKNIPSSPVDLNEILKQVLIDLDWQIEQQRALILRSELPTIEADAFQMTQLFQNLLANAIKFHPPDQPPVVHISALQQDVSKDGTALWEIIIKDEGIGFDAKYAERIFQPFQRLHDQSEFEGTGMGLAICRKIVDRHGGSIRVRSEPGKGTTFILLLPAKQRTERLGPA